jgi:hypothetical protein
MHERLRRRAWKTWGGAGSGYEDTVQEIAVLGGLPTDRAAWTPLVEAKQFFM